MVQKRMEKQTGRRPQGEVEEAQAAERDTQVTDAASETVADIDDVLDAQLDEEILADMDEALEADAEEFVKNYVQCGGQ